MQRDTDTLIRHLQARARNPQLATSMSERYPKLSTLHPPLVLRHVKRAEKALGFEIPSFLARVYMEVGNGGWGPGYGFLPLIGKPGRINVGGSLYHLWSGVRQTLSFIRKITPDYLYREKFLTMCDFGCTYYSTVDCTTSTGVVRAWDASGEFYGPPQADSVFEWLEIWVEGKMDGFGWAHPSAAEG